MVEQPLLGNGAVACRIGTEHALRAQHAVAGNDDRKGIARTSLADRARTRSGLPRERAIAQRLAIADAGDRLAQCLAARSGGRRKRQVEADALPGKPLFQLEDRFAQMVADAVLFEQAGSDRH